MANRYLITGGGSVTWDASNTAIWSAASGGATGASVPVDGDAVIMDGASGGGTVTLGYNPTITSITMGAFTGTFDASTYSPTMSTFSCSGTGTRTLSMGSGTWTITGNNGNVVSFGTITNLTLDAGTSTFNLSYSDSTGTRTFFSSSLTFNNLTISAGSDTFASSANLGFKDVSFVGFTGTWTVAAGFSIGGNLTLGTGMTVTSASNTLNFINPTNSLLRTNGVQINIPITIAKNDGYSITLQDALDMNGASARTLTLQSGTFDANNFNVTCGIFSSSNSNVRTLTMGSGTWTLTGSNTQIWNISTSTNSTITGTGTIVCSYSGSTGTRSFLGASNRTLNNISVIAGTDIFGLNNVVANSLNFTGFTGSANLTSNATSLNGNFTLGTGMTWTSGTQNLNFIGTSGTQTFTSNGIQINQPIVVNAVGGTVQLADSLDMGGSSARTFTLTAGTFDANNKNVTTGLFASTNSNARTLTMGSGTWTLTGTGTVWNTATTTNFTLNPDTSKIIINDASAASKTFSSGVATFYDVLLTGAGTGTFIIGAETATTTFNNIEVDTPPHTVQVYAGKTLRVGSLSISGTYGALNTIQSTTGGTPWNITSPSSVVSANYISLQDSVASGSIFYAGADSVDVSGNTGWTFLNRPLLISDTASRDQNYVTTILGNDSTDPTKAVSIYANPDTHGLLVNDRTTGADQGAPEAARDRNYVPAMVAVSSLDGVTPVVVYADSISHQLLIDSN